MKRLAPLILLVLLSSCYPKSRILNWYHTQAVKPDPKVTGNVGVFGFVFPADPSPTKDFWALTEQGQKAYIKEVGLDVDKPEKLAAAIALPFGRAGNGTLIDLSTFKKKVVFTVSHRSEKPADRIANLELRLVLPDTGLFEFVTWDKIVTQYSTVEFGTVSLTGTNTFKLAPEITMAGDILGTTAGELSRVEAMTEEAKLAKRFIDVNGSLSRNQAWLTLNGMPGRDLAGNVIAEVTMKAKTTASFVLFEFADLFKDDKPNKSDAVKVGEVWVKVPYARQAVSASAKYNVCVRRVTNGARTIAEGDDNVQLCCADGVALKDGILLVDGDEFDVKLYYLINNTTNQYLGLAGAGVNGQVAPVALRSLDEAIAFRKWLQVGGETSVGGVRLKWSGDQIDTDYAAVDARGIILEENSLQPKYKDKFFSVK